MEYQNTDESIRKNACEKVKQIVKAIKAIKMKYYLIFSKISVEDKETYQRLEQSLEKISEENDLDYLKVALMQEVYARYNGTSPEDFKQEGSFKPDDILQACYGAIDVQKDALSKGKITQALRCQEQLKRYREQLSSEQDIEIINYKREKFAELMQTREQLEEQVQTWNNTMKGMYRIEDVTKRRDTMQIIQEAQDRENILIVNDSQEDMALTM